MRKINSDHLYILFVILLIFGLFQLSVFNIYGFSLYPDEFGYWASAATHVGYDWSTIASLGSYYSFGYSLLLTPILFVFKGGLAAYRAAIAVNYILIALSFMLLYRLMVRLFNDRDHLRSILICAVAVLYPPWILYSQMTMAESLIIFLYILLCYLLVEYIFKPDVIKLILLVFVSLYLYSVHMRTIGVIIAVFVTYMVMGFKDEKNRKLTVIMIIAASVAVILFVFLKRKTIGNVFSTATQEDIEINGYGGQIWKIKDIFTAEGFRNFLVEILGKTYYLVVSTYGLLIFAVMSMIKGIRAVFVRNTLRKKEACRVYFKLFLFMSLIGEILISSVFLHMSDRADMLFYGRYDEFIAPVIIAVGLFEVYDILRNGRIARYMITAISISLGVIAVVPLFIKYLKDKEFPSLRGYFVTGISYLNEYNEYDPTLYVWRTALVGVALVLIMFITVWVTSKYSWSTFLIGILIVCQILLSFRLSDQWTYRINGYVYSNNAIMDELKEHPERAIYYLNIDENFFIDFFQFGMPKREIIVVSPEELDGIDMKNGYLMVNWSYEGLEELKARYSYYMESEMMFAFYDE